MFLIPWLISLILALTFGGIAFVVCGLIDLFRGTAKSESVIGWLDSMANQASKTR